MRKKRADKCQRLFFCCVPQISVFRLFYVILLSVNLDLFARKNAIIVKTSNVFVGSLFLVCYQEAVVRSYCCCYCVPFFFCLLTFIHADDGRRMFDEQTNRHKLTHTHILYTYIFRIDSYLLKPLQFEKWCSCSFHFPVKILSYSRK